MILRDKRSEHFSLSEYSKPFIEEEILELEDIIASSTDEYDTSDVDLIDPEI